MEEAKKQKIESNMDDVIESSKALRKWLERDDISFEEKASELKVINTKLKLNNNIVSASIVQVQIEKLGE